MENIISPDTLREAIVRLEDLRQEQELELADEFGRFIDRLKPSTIIREALRDVTHSSAVHHDLFNAAMGLVSGFLARKIFAGSRPGLLRKALGAALQFGISAVVKQRGDAIRAGGRQFLSSLSANRGNNGWS